MKRILKIVGFGFLGVVVLLGLLFFIAGIPLSTKTMEQLADSFQPGESWVLESENIVPGRVFCPGGKCNYIHKSWKLPEKIENREEFVKYARLNGQMMEVSEDCFVDRSRGARTNNCQASIVADGYRATLDYSHFNNENPEMILRIRRNYEG